LSRGPAAYKKVRFVPRSSTPSSWSFLNSLNMIGFFSNYYLSPP
jgi:hypothetical protein